MLGLPIGMQQNEYISPSVYKLIVNFEMYHINIANWHATSLSKYIVWIQINDIFIQWYI